MKKTSLNNNINFRCRSARTLMAARVLDGQSTDSDTEESEQEGEV